MKNKLKIFAHGAVITAFSAGPLLAQSVTGGVDPAVGISNLTTYLTPLAIGAIGMITVPKGVHAAAEGRSIMPHLAAMIGGTAFVLSGAYVIQAYT